MRDDGTADKLVVFVLYRICCLSSAACRRGRGLTVNVLFVRLHTNRINAMPPK
jgi:hypothetical protein